MQVKIPGEAQISYLFAFFCSRFHADIFKEAAITQSKDASSAQSQKQFLHLLTWRMNMEAKLKSSSFWIKFTPTFGVHLKLKLSNAQNLCDTPFHI